MSRWLWKGCVGRTQGSNEGTRTYSYKCLYLSHFWKFMDKLVFMFSPSIWQICFNFCRRSPYQDETLQFDISYWITRFNTYFLPLLRIGGGKGPPWKQDHALVGATFCVCYLSLRNGKPFLDCYSCGSLLPCWDHDIKLWETLKDTSVVCLFICMFVRTVTYPWGSPGSSPPFSVMQNWHSFFPSSE